MLTKTPSMLHVIEPPIMEDLLTVLQSHVPEYNYSAVIHRNGITIAKTSI